MTAAPPPRPVDMRLVNDIEAAWAVGLSPEDRAGLLQCLSFYLPRLSERQSITGRRGAPPKDNEKRFVVELGLRYECAGGRVAGSWRRDGRTITGQFAAGLRVVWDAIRLACARDQRLKEMWTAAGIDLEKYPAEAKAHLVEPSAGPVQFIWLSPIAGKNTKSSNGSWT